MSLQAVIIAVLVLIVLVVLIVIFTRTSGGFAKGATSCADKGGSCQGECSSGETRYRIGDLECSSGEACCIPESSILGQPTS